jgi:PAS domain-containing protein
MIDDELSFTDANMLRKKAEEKLIEKQKKKDLPVNEIEEKKLLHELLVHQIELEMQNEELKQANDTAEAALRKYTMLYDLAPVGFFILDPDGSICDLNFTGAELLGDRRFSLINSNFKLFVSNDSKQAFGNFFSKVYENDGKESCEVSLGYDETHLCQVYMEGILTGDDQKCLLSVVKVSGFKIKPSLD